MGLGHIKMTTQVQECSLLDFAIDAFRLDQSIRFIRLARLIAFDRGASDKHGRSMTESTAKYKTIEYDYGTTFASWNTMSLYPKVIYFCPSLDINDLRRF